MSEKLTRRHFAKTGWWQARGFPILFRGRPSARTIGSGSASSESAIAGLLIQLPEGAEIVAVPHCLRTRSEEAAAKRKANWRIYDDC